MTQEERRLIPLVYFQSLARMDMFSGESIISACELVNGNPNLTKRVLDQVKKTKKENSVDSSTDMSEFLELPKLKQRSGLLGYRPSLGLIFEDENKFLKLSRLGRELIQQNENQQMQSIFLLVCLFFPHIRAIFEKVRFNEFYIKRGGSWPTNLNNYYMADILPDGGTHIQDFSEIVKELWRNDTFLREFFVKLDEYDGLINKEFGIPGTIEFIFQKDKFVFNTYTIKAIPRLLGIKDDKIREKIFTISPNPENSMVKVNLKKSILNARIDTITFRKIFDWAEGESLSFDRILDYFKSRLRQATLYSLEVIDKQLQEDGFSHDEIREWREEVEQYYDGVQQFCHPKIKIKCAAGSVGATGFLGKTSLAQFQFEILG